MINVTGLYNNAICYTDELETTAYEQIKAVCDQKAFSDCKIRIMPDVHAGMGCTIGTTMTITDKIVPGMVGVDIGCGMETVQTKEKTLDYPTLDKLIRREIPFGRNVRDSYHPFNKNINLNELRCAKKLNIERAKLSIGSLGGGNHFIEAGCSEKGALYITVHSGSRHIGTEVAEYYQNEAEKTRAAGLPKDLAYVSGHLFDDYIHDMKIIQHFAVLNRKAMMDIILKGMKLTECERFTTIHNYIDTDSMILRKGAVSAKKGERLLLPINMRDGSLICAGKGNDDWNCSAPHGAGRLMSRKSALKTLSMDEYIKAMDGIYTTSVNRHTLDESPMAYKSIEDIINHIAPAADIIARVRPVYNFKAND